MPPRSTPPDEVLLWTVGLDAFRGDLSRLEALLAPEERRRAEGLPERRALEFVVGRATLRAALSERTGVDPQELPLTTGERGKPALSNGGDLHFNVSHAAGLVLLALAASRPVGVDVEQVRPRPRLDRVAARVFSPAERARLAELDRRERLEFFFGTWTAREACLKATGQGMPASPEGFDVPAWPAGLDGAVEVGGPQDSLALRRWAPAPGYLAALAAPGTEWRLVRPHLPRQVAQARRR